MKNVPIQQEIDIVMAADENYIFQTRVAVWSVMEASSADYRYRFHILCNGQLERDSREKVNGLKDIFGNIEIEFIEVDDSIFKNAVIIAYLTVAACYRLVMTEVIDADKCIFLDVDTIVRVDISKLYETDMSGYYIAGVLDWGMQIRPDEAEEHRKMIDLPTMEGYINSGVLVCNLKKMRDDRMYGKFMSSLNRGYTLVDQDVINKCCYGKIKLLNVKYNLLSEFYRHTDKLKNIGTIGREVDEVDENDMLIHFAGGYKPWEYIRINASWIWWEVARKALSEADYKRLYAQAVQFAIQSDWSYLLELSRKQKDIIIVGFSDIGRGVAESLLWGDIKNIRCYCDNDRKKQGMVYEGMEVLPIPAACCRYPQALWIVTSQNYHKEIKMQLRDLGVDSDKIIQYMEKGRVYYERIDESYKEHEKREKKLKDYCKIAKQKVT